MDTATATVIATTITTLGMIVVALIGVARDNDKAVRKALAPKDEEIHRLREKVITLGGDPDAK